MTQIDEAVLDELYRKLGKLDVKNGDDLDGCLIELGEVFKGVIDWSAYSQFESIDGDICRMIVHGVDAYLILLDDEELSDILPRLNDFITAVKGLLWFVGKNL